MFFYLRNEMKNLLFLIAIALLLPSKTHSREFNDSSRRDGCKQKTLIYSTIGLTYGGSMAVLYNVWYKKEDRSQFHKFNDGNLWLQMDKAGHSYASYQISSLTNSMLEWAGCQNKKSSLLAGSIALAYQSTLEIFDGFSSDWGFSWYDMSANLVGSGFFVAQELIWKEQRILPKFSYHPTDFAKIRPDVLGSSFGERLLKDYNGQTYWLSFNPFQYMKNSIVPKWVCFSLGYSSHEKLKGDTEIYTASNGTVYHAQREWLLSMDIDFSKIPVKRPIVKKILKQLNYLKLPFPALLLRNGKLHGMPLYF